MYTQLDYYFIILPFSSPHTPSSRTLVVCDLHALETTCFGMLSPLFLVVLEQHRDRDPAQPYNAAYPLLKPRNPNWTNNNYALTHREAYLSVYAFPLQLSSTRLWVLFVCQPATHHLCHWNPDSDSIANCVFLSNANVEIWYIYCFLCCCYSSLLLICLCVTHLYARFLFTLRRGVALLLNSWLIWCPRSWNLR